MLSSPAVKPDKTWPKAVGRWLYILLSMAFMARTAHSTDFSELLSRPLPKPTYHLPYGTEASQFGDLWLPDSKEPHPVVIMIHGGCWLAQLPGAELMAQISEDLRKSGIAVWNIEYRRLKEKGAGYPGTFLDVADAADALRKMASPYHLDLSHVIAVGHSAGGHLALWTAARAKMNAQSPLYRRAPLPVKGVITLAGIDDLADYRDHGPSACGGPSTINKLVDAENRKQPYADTSPAALLPLGVPQVIVSGDQDAIVPDGFGNEYAAKARLSKDKVTTVDIKGADHFDLIDPASAAWPQIKALVLAQLQ